MLHPPPPRGRLGGDYQHRNVNELSVSLNQPVNEAIGQPFRSLDRNQDVDINTEVRTEVRTEVSHNQDQDGFAAQRVGTEGVPENGRVPARPQPLLPMTPVWRSAPLPPPPPEGSRTSLGSWHAPLSDTTRSRNRACSSGPNSARSPKAYSMFEERPLFFFLESG
eukprot:gene25636-biopygen7506